MDVMKSRTAIVLILVGLCLALMGGAIPARQIADWPYDKLFKHADLVVIVLPVSVRDAAEKDKAVPPRGMEDYLVGVVTSFKVLHVVKGDYKEKKLDLVHFKLNKKGMMIGNGPSLVSFHTKSIR